MTGSTDNNPSDSWYSGYPPEVVEGFFVQTDDDRRTSLALLGRWHYNLSDNSSRHIILQGSEANPRVRLVRRHGSASHSSTSWTRPRLASSDPVPEDQKTQTLNHALVVDIATQITEKTAKELKSARVVRLLPSNNWDRRVNNACEAERLVIFEALDKPYWLNCTNPHTKTVVYCPTTMKHFPTMLPKKTTEAFIVLPHDFGANGPTTWLSLLESLDDAEGAQEVSRPVVSFLKSLGALKGYWDNPDNQQIIHDKLPPPPPTGAETWLRLMDVISMWHKRVKCIIVVGINELPPERFGIHPGAEPRHRSSGKGSYTPFFDLAAQHSSSRRHDVADYLKTYSNVRFVPLSQYNNKNPYDLDFRSA